MKTELDKIWESEYFNTGNKYFQLYNYNFFRIIEKAEFQEYNPNAIHPDKQIFAVADKNGDREHLVYLYFDGQGEIFIQSNLKWIEPVNLRKIAISLEQLFEGRDFSEVLINERDQDFWEWYERVYHSYEVETSVPKGVLPNIDLRAFFKDRVAGTFLSDHKEINERAFIKYFEEFGIVNLDIEYLFQSRPMPEDLKAFVEGINTQLNDTAFYVVSFNPSGFWGIGNSKLLTDEQKQQLYNYGLI